ncbi:hypothetical protein EVG20_g8221 [Dentipellis fragilis]|uniref:Serine hydrolase domain-containing protein n=1 Tax=Dentipellis fragilis TaxID=205917 RepID=A0A4Y9Y9Y3_9AGAM|nr:hypothetical protein EVG20_g8221 [Dentipellis fragilis]
MSAPTVPRVLMLHGYTQNADIFRKRLSALRKTCGKAIEFVFVDAPIVLYPADLAETFGTAAPSTDDASSSGGLAALGAAEATAATDDPKLTPRAWWKANAARTKADGMDESVVWLRDLLKEQKFDGIFGFSQGAAMAVILAGLLERPEVYPQFLVDGQAPHPPFKFCVSVSGFEPAGEIPAALFTSPINTPTLHVIGKNDVVVAEERSRKALDLTTNGRVEWHDGGAPLYRVHLTVSAHECRSHSPGHFVPSKANWRNFFKAYLLDPLGDVPGPGPHAAISAWRREIRTAIVSTREKTPQGRVEAFTRTLIEIAKQAVIGSYCPRPVADIEMASAMMRWDKDYLRAQYQCLATQWTTGPETLGSHKALCARALPVVVVASPALANIRLKA